MPKMLSIFCLICNCLFFILLAFIEYSWFMMLYSFLVYCKVIQIYMYMCVCVCIYICVCVYICLFIPFQYGLLQDIESNSLCCSVGLRWLPILHIVICICESQTPNFCTCFFSLLLKDWWLGTLLHEALSAHRIWDIVSENFFQK